jgi:hypothetical protein
MKAILPIPVGIGRIGGDGKALMLGPEMQYLTQTIVGGMGIPSEFLFGGLSFTGSSVSLRTLENDFIQNRSQLLDVVNWIKSKIIAWTDAPRISKLRFSDFRMADDVQRNQQLIGLNAAGKVSDQTLLTELGYDYEEEIKKRLEELHIQNYFGEFMAKSQAKQQGESMIVASQFQLRAQEIAQKAQTAADAKVKAALTFDNAKVFQGIAQKLIGLDPSVAEAQIAQIKVENAPIGAAVEQAYRALSEIEIQAQQQFQQAQQQEAQMQVEMQAQQQALPAPKGADGMASAGQGAAEQAPTPSSVSALPEPTQKPPRRQGGV